MEDNSQARCFCNMVKDWCAVCREYESEEARAAAMKTIKALTPKVAKRYAPKAAKRYEPPKK